jgi:hypothetical protein
MSYLNGTMKLESKSVMFRELIQKLDRQLSHVEATDYYGKNMMNSNEKAKHEGNVKNIFLADDFGNIYKPFNQEICTILVNDEIKHKQKDKK